MIGRELTPRTVQRLWTASGLVVLAAATAGPLTLAHSRIPSVRSMAEQCTVAATPRFELGWILGVISTAVVLCAVLRGAGSLLRAAQADVRLTRLDGVRCTVGGRAVVRVDGATPVAFCAGVVRPRIYVTEGAWRMLTPAELEAVVHHEGYHRDRREPLRQSLRDALAAALFFVPVLRAIEPRVRVMEELHADAAALRATHGDRRPLAAALLRFETSPAAGAGVLAERVDALTGRPPGPWRMPVRCVLRSAGQLGLVGVLCAAVALAAASGQVVLLQACSLAVIAVVAAFDVAMRAPSWLHANVVLRRRLAVVRPPGD